MKNLFLFIFTIYALYPGSLRAQEICYGDSDLASGLRDPAVHFNTDTFGVVVLYATGTVTGIGDDVHDPVTVCVNKVVA